MPFRAASMIGRVGAAANGVAGRIVAALLSATALASPALASELGLRLSILTRDSGQPIVMDMSSQLGLLFIGLLILTATTSVLHISGRQRWSRRLAEQDAEIGELQAKLQRAEIFMSGERHVVIAWGSATGEPDIEGDVGLIVGAGAPRRILGFSQWLPSADAKRLEQSVEKLKLKGEGFAMSADGAGGKRLEIEGLAVAGRAVMRIREVSGDRLERAKAEEKVGKLTGEMAALHAVLDSLSHPIWLRYADGRLAWVNKSFAEAVDCRHPNEAISKGLELIDRPLRERIAAESDGKPYHGRVAAIISGRRTMLEISDVRTPFGSGGIAVDAAETEGLRVKLEAEMATHVRTLNELPIAVAIFDRKQQLRFSNTAYQKLWMLDPEFLKTQPGDSEIIDRLRAARRIPEQVDFRSWKHALLESYQKNEPVEHLWHLPDGRMLRVAANPTPDGGVSYVYDDLTDRMALEASFKVLSRVQNETLDSLREGVAVFGSDGRLKLANAAFSTLWRLHAEALQDNPHIDEVMRRSPLAGDSPAWLALRGAITGLADARESLRQRDSRPDGSVIDCVTSPLPDGGTLITFSDVTANVNAERFLSEKNEALETAARVKNDFIQNVSYGLREPLQGVTMSASILTDETTMGALSPKQREYAEAAKRSADTLLLLMNDIFDLSSLDAGTIALDLEPVSPAAEIAAVATTLGDKLSTSGVMLKVDVQNDSGTFEADPQRIRQVLFHLCANAIGFSSPGQSIEIAVKRDREHMAFTVSDKGRGIPEAALARIFERFESHNVGSSHRGVGLGLSMVKAPGRSAQGQGDAEVEAGRGHGRHLPFPAEGRPGTCQRQGGLTP